MATEIIGALPTGTNIIGKVRPVTATGDEATDDTHDAIKNLEHFGGNVYSKTMTMASDAATRFETSAKKLRDVVIAVTTQNMLLGETGVEVFPLAAGSSINFSKVDISTLYFKNAAAGQNGTIIILGTEE